MKRTPWFYPDVQPVHPGVYQIAHSLLGTFLYAHWSPAGWGCLAATPDEAVRRDWPEARVPSRGAWRGLTKRLA